LPVAEKTILFIPEGARIGGAAAERMLAMVPLSLDPAAVPLAVAGRGDRALARFTALVDGGAVSARLYCDQPGPVLARAAGQALRPRLPELADLAELRALWVAGLPAAEAAALAEAARQARVLVNVEDRPALCDFHNAAVVRRGDLLLTVSTGGRSPGLAARIRARLEAEFGREWAARVEALGQERAAWRRERRSVPDLARLTDAAIERRGWLA
jgi:precorrin-2 dehydrogenase/sirohydrochlorin ferrochelatase